jgi:hypothetical protein
MAATAATLPKDETASVSLSPSNRHMLGSCGTQQKAPGVRLEAGHDDTEQRNGGGCQPVMPA